VIYQNTRLFHLIFCWLDLHRPKFYGGNQHRRRTDLATGIRGMRGGETFLALPTFIATEFAIEDYPP
jgi:hypothetical protein